MLASAIWKYLVSTRGTNYNCSFLRVAQWMRCQPPPQKKTLTNGLRLGGGRLLDRQLVREGHTELRLNSLKRWCVILMLMNNRFKQAIRTFKRGQMRVRAKQIYGNVCRSTYSLSINCKPFLWSKIPNFTFRTDLALQQQTDITLLAAPRQAKRLATAASPVTVYHCSPAQSHLAAAPLLTTAPSHCRPSLGRPARRSGGSPRRGDSDQHRGGSWEAGQDDGVSALRQVVLRRCHIRLSGHMVQCHARVQVYDP